MTQGLELLFDLDNRSYSRIVGAPVQTSIGKCYREVLADFLSVVRGLSGGEINHNRRTENPRFENEVTFATITTCDILRALKRCSEQQLNRSCEVTFSGNGGDCVRTSFTSDLSREIANCVNNAIQQFSTIREVCTELGLSVPQRFGTVPSTLEYHAAIAAD
jgi:hypothetical protein